MREFTLRIKLGNDAMYDGEDVANVLRDIADDVRYMDRDAILDLNGNRVGEWGFTE